MSHKKHTMTEEELVRTAPQNMGDVLMQQDPVIDKIREILRTGPTDLFKVDAIRRLVFPDHSNM